MTDDKNGFWDTEDELKTTDVSESAVDGLVSVLRDVLSGKVHPELKYPQHAWVEAPPCIFIIDDWEMSFFNDGGEVDYLEWAKHTVKGTVWTFSDNAKNTHPMDPVDHLTDIERGKLENIFRSVR